MLEDKFHLDFARRFRLRIHLEVARLYHQDADNSLVQLLRHLDPARDRGLIVDRAGGFRDLLAEHGAAVARIAPGLYGDYLQQAATSAIYAGRRGEALRSAVALVVRSPGSGRNWIMIWPPRWREQLHGPAPRCTPALARGLRRTSFPPRQHHADRPADLPVHASLFRRPNCLARGQPGVAKDAYCPRHGGSASHMTFGPRTQHGVATMYRTSIAIAAVLFAGAITAGSLTSGARATLACLPT